NGAIAALQSPNLAWRYLGWQALKGFGDKAAPALQKMFETAAPNHRARALWVFGKLNVPADKRIGAISAGLKRPNPDLRETAVRAAGISRRSALPPKGIGMSVCRNGCR